MSGTLRRRRLIWSAILCAALAAPTSIGTASSTLAVSPAAPPTSPPTARDFEFRAEFGLSTSASALANALATNEPWPAWGVALSRSEEADLANRVRIENELPPLLVALESEPSFAGLSIDQKAGGVLDIATTAAGKAQVDALITSLAPAGATIRVRTVPNSLRVLRELKDEIGEEMEGNTALGREINSLRVELGPNRVVVGVGKTNYTEATRALSARFAGRPIDFEEADTFAPAACSRDSCTPLRAGLRITFPSGCTSNFVAFAGANYHLLTAGHCGPLNGDAKHAGASIGKVVKTAWHDGTFADALIIDIDNAKKSNLVFINAAEPGRPITSRMPLNGDVVGSSVCGSGINTKFFCGTVTNTDIDGRATNGFVIRHLQICTVDVRQGDSGGPMFYGNKAMGVASLINGPKHTGPDGVDYWENTMFSQIRDAELQLVVTVYTG